MNEYARYGGPGWRTRTRSETQSDTNSMAWFLAGIGLGAAIALLLTPATGQELRTAFTRGFRNTLYAVNRGTQRLRERAPNVIRFSRRSGLSGT